MQTTDFVGTWQLVSCEHRLESGEVKLPFGPKPYGRLVYTADGYMIVMLGDPSRPLFKSYGFLEGKEAELAAAARGFVAYSGRWELKEGQLLHHVDISLFPNWVGTSQVRSVKLEGNRATLFTKPFTTNGITQAAHLIWEREGDPSIYKAVK